MYFDGMPNPNGNCDVQIFKQAATVTNTQWMTWRKPPGKAMCSMFLLGGGGGGGGGFTGISGSARGGGGSGGSSAQTSLTIPLMFLPETLYIQVGAGGQGVGSGGGVAPSGILSYVAIVPSNASAGNIVAVSGAAGPTGGGTGTVAAAGAAGAAGTIPVIGSMVMGAAGQFTLLVGAAGSAGGVQTGAVGVFVTIPLNGLRCMAGSGGAGTQSANFAGGLCTAIADQWLSEQRPATPAAGSFDGSGGVQLWKPFFSFGGLGGSSSNTGIGGAGGNGALGAGGGGGGGGTTGGRGGAGGNGVVIVCSW